VSQLAEKLEGLVGLNGQNVQLGQRNAWLEQEVAEMRRTLRHNRGINDGIDHLWSVKEAEYANIDSILRAL
jgi:hypothetical protein